MSSRGLALPPPLQRGDTVALVAPSSPVTPEGGREAVRALECLGFRVRPGRTLSQVCRGYGAGSPEIRAEDLNRAFADPEIRVVWCIRGGYTGAQVLPLLDYEAIARSPKPLIGYSDITVFHTALQQRCGFVTYHGPMVYSDLVSHPSSATLEALWPVLSMRGSLTYRNPGGQPLYCLRPGRAEGVLTGGNLTVLVSQLGTPWALDAAGKILFLEDVGEPVPVLERMLCQLRAAGVLDRAAGVLLGCFTDCKNRFWPEYDAIALFRDFFRRDSIPVLAGLQCGHCHPNGTLPLGCWCALDAQRNTICLQGGQAG